MISSKHQNTLLESLSKLAGCQTAFAPVSYGNMSYLQAACGGLFSGVSNYAIAHIILDAG